MIKGGGTERHSIEKREQQELIKDGTKVCVVSLRLRNFQVHLTGFGEIRIGDLNRHKFCA